MPRRQTMSIIWHETSMPHVDPGRDFSDVWRGPTRRWLALSLGAALLAVMGNVGALLSVGRTYGVSYPSLTDQAIAQDMVSLAIVVPLLVLTALHAELGS